MTPGYYTVSYSANGAVGPSSGNIYMYLYKNGLATESLWSLYEDSGALNNNIAVVGSRIVVSNISECFLNFGGFP